MQYRYWLLAGVLAHAGAAQAMGLGQMEVRSHLGSPLQADLNLFSPGTLDQQEIQVRIARLDAYDRLGARYDPFHGQITFDVRRDANGQIQIVATSRNRVTEPFLDIVVELSWPSGTTYRRYNLLVDPPNYALRWQNTQPKPRGAPLEKAALQLATQTRPVPAPAKAPVKTVPERAAHPGALPAGEAYVVRSGDSLWKIARRMSGNGAVSVHGVMQTLFVTNPQAFIQGDRNRLRLGATLYLPAGESAPTTQVAAAQPQQHADIPDDRLAIQAAIARLQREKRELQEYQEQLKTEMAEVLQQRIAATEALLQAEGQQAQSTQATVSVSVPAPASVPVASDVATFEPAGPQPQANEPHPLSVQQGVPAAAQPASVVSVEAVAPRARSLSDVRIRDLLAVAESPSPASDMAVAVAAQDMLNPMAPRADRIHISNGLWYLVAMLPLGILLLLMGMRSRRVQKIRRTDKVKNEDLHELVFGSRRDRTQAEAPDQLQHALSQIREKADTHGRQRQQQLATEVLDARDDLKQMVDLYLVYSQYQKALNVILTEITKRPASADLRLYLMRVYAEMGDWQAFAEQEEVLRRLGQDHLLEQASLLRSGAA